MDFASYSLALIAAFATARYVTENTKIHLKFKGLWIHHWILAALAMAVMYYLKIEQPYLWGGLTGIALEGLPRKNWSIRHKK
mgnify:FL=1